MDLRTPSRCREVPDSTGGSSSEHGSGGGEVAEGIAKHAYEVLQEAKVDGSTLLVGDGQLEAAVAMKPTIVLSLQSRIVDKEAFGPSASLYVVEEDWTRDTYEMCRRKS